MSDEAYLRMSIANARDYIPKSILKRYNAKPKGEAIAKHTLHASRGASVFQGPSNAYYTAIQQRGMSSQKLASDKNYSIRREDMNRNFIKVAQQMTQPISKDDSIHEGIVKLALSDKHKAMLGMPVAGGLAGAGIYGLAQAGRKGALPLGKRLARGGGVGAGIGLAATALIGIGEMLSKADPSGKGLEAIAKLAPAAIAVGGAAMDRRK